MILGKISSTEGNNPIKQAAQGSWCKQSPSMDIFQRCVDMALGDTV